MTAKNYIVTINKNYYPEIEYCNTLEEAEEIRRQLIEINQIDSGEGVCLITIAKTIQTMQIQICY